MAFPHSALRELENPEGAFNSEILAISQTGKWSVIQCKMYSAEPIEQTFSLPQNICLNECKPEIFSHFILLSNAGNTDLVFHKNSLLTAVFREFSTQWMWNQVLVLFHLHTIKLGRDPWSQNSSFTLIKSLCFRWAASNLWLKPNSMYGYSKTTASDGYNDDRVQKQFSEN